MIILAGKKDSKLKLLYIKDILETYSDEENVLNAGDIAQHLYELGIECERKSIYKDIDILIEYGLDIIKTSKPKTGWFIASREFEPAELRLLSDAVQAANFISKKKTRSLLEKTERLTSVENAKKLRKQVFIDSRNKCNNEEIFYSISSLDEAIKNFNKVKLTYVKRKLDNKFAATNEKKEFILSPYALIWSNDHYYLVANNEKYDNLMHLRIDRIRKVEILAETARHFSEVSDYKTSFNCADYVSKTFNMFSGNAQSTELRCRIDILEDMLDRFGEKVSIKRAESGWFYIHDDLYINDGLASWIMQFGNNIEVIYPESLREMIAIKAKEISEMYETNRR